MLCTVKTQYFHSLVKNVRSELTAIWVTMKRASISDYLYTFISKPRHIQNPETYLSNEGQIRDTQPLVTTVSTYHHFYRTMK